MIVSNLRKLLLVCFGLASSLTQAASLECGTESSHVSGCAAGKCPLEGLLHEEFITDPSLIVDSTTLNTYRVPPVAERALNPDAGDKVIVKSFVVQGVAANPEKGISPESVQAMADALYIKAMEGKAEPALTVGQMVKVSDEITTHYRSSGYLVAKAFIPVQTVSDDGVVRIQVLEGRVSEIVVEGNNHFDAKNIARPAQPLVGRIPIREAVETSLLYSLDHPGIRLFGTFRPGEETGDARLILQVLDEDRLAFNLGVDNYGIELTGEIRTRVDMAWNDPLGLADRLDVTLLQSINPANTTYGAVDYRVPVGPRGFGLFIGGGSNEFRINDGPFAAIDLQGTITNYKAGVDWRFIRSRFFNAQTKLGYTQKQSALDGVGGSLDISNDTTGVVGLEAGFDRLDTVYRGVDLGFARWRQGVSGEFIGVNANKLQPDFSILDFSYTRVQPIAETQSLVGRLRVQKAFDAVSSLEQFSLTGPDAVRAYPVGEALRDSGRFLSIEYKVQAPGFSAAPGPFSRRWGDLLQFWLFADYAYGEFEGATGANRAELSGYGASVQFAIPGSFQFLMHGAKPLSSLVASDGDDFRIFAEMSYRF